MVYIVVNLKWQYIYIYVAVSMLCLHETHLVVVYDPLVKLL